jgi:sulfur-oxidizing protein SoxZ
MASKSTRLKAKAENGETTVKALIKHPMETGRRKDKETGELVPSHYIKEVTCSYQGEPVLKTEWGPTISRNPFLSFTFTGGAPGEEVELSWEDNKGNSESASATIT